MFQPPSNMSRGTVMVSYTGLGSLGSRDTQSRGDLTASGKGPLLEGEFGICHVNRN